MTPQGLPTIEHAGMLDDLDVTPGHVLPGHTHGKPIGAISCSFCGVGDSGFLVEETVEQNGGTVNGDAPRAGTLLVERDGKTLELPVSLAPPDAAGMIRMEVQTSVEVAGEAGLLTATLKVGESTQPVAALECGRTLSEAGALRTQSFMLYRRTVMVTRSRIQNTVPTAGCVKLKLSRMQQRPAFPIHTAPTVLEGGKRKEVSYREAIGRLADLVLEHRPPKGRTLIYACGQIDYFTIFAMQEVFRLLGVRNLTGNAEHCLNAGAVHNEILTGQEGPFLTLDQAVNGPDRFYLFNGWNGFVTHPPAFAAIHRREDLDAYMIEVVVSESAKALAKKLGPDRILLVRPRADPHIALAVANEILREYPDAVSRQFVERFGDEESFRKFVELASSPTYEPERVAARIAPEPGYEERLYKGIRTIAHRLAASGSVPIVLPSVGLSQTSGVVAHCLWGSTLAMLGKYGLNADSTPAGGVLRLPGQINAESEVQGLSRKYFFGRIPMDQAAEAAARMGLPADAYEEAVKDTPRTALDYSDATLDTQELFLCFGTQFESNMMDRLRFIRKLKDPNTKLVVVDPVPDPFSVENADLILPSPPHPAVTKVYQNGEWKLSVSVPTKRAAAETRSDPTIIYDLIAEIAERLERDPELAAQHPDLAGHARSGYLKRRFCPPADGNGAAGNGASGPSGLIRVDGEVSRPQLWSRVQEYLGGGCGPLYCRPDHPDGRPIEWQELLDQGSVVYGGVGTRRYRLDYDDPECQPYGDLYRRPRQFKFFVPTREDMVLPEGIILTSGRSSLSDDRERVQFATATFNSGKATPTVGMPDDNPLFVSPSLAGRVGLKTGGWARVTNRITGHSEVFPVEVSDRVKGDTCYISFHKCKAEIEQGRYVNTVTSHVGRCPYTAQTTVKATQILLEPALAPPVKIPGADEKVPSEPAILLPQLRRPDTTCIDPTVDLPVWTGQNTPLYVTDIIKETHDVTTFRFQGDPPCRFVYLPGQFCTLVLNIDGKKVLRSYSISSSPTRPYILEITVKRVPGGLVSNWLADNLEIGSRIEVTGPRGKFCLTPGNVGRKLLFLSGGSGITPVMAMSRWLCDVGADVDIVFINSVRSPDDIVFEREFEWLTRFKMFRPFHITFTRESRRGWGGLTGHITKDMLQLACPDLLERDAYMCGPEPFMDCARGLLEELGFDMSRLHQESFGGVRTAAANKSAPVRQEVAGAAPVAPVVETETTAPVGTIAVEFARSGKTAMTDGKLPLLDFAEANDVELDYSCRSGSCGSCKAKLLKGEVDQATDEGLDAAEKVAGFILTCVATPKTDVVLDA